LSAVYDFTQAGIAKAVEMLIEHRQLTVEQSETVREALQHFRKKSNVSFSDCLLLEVARKAGHLPLGACCTICKSHPYGRGMR